MRLNSKLLIGLILIEIFPLFFLGFVENKTFTYIEPRLESFVISFILISLIFTLIYLCLLVSSNGIGKHKKFSQYWKFFYILLVLLTLLNGFYTSLLFGSFSRYVSGLPLVLVFSQLLQFILFTTYSFFLFKNNQKGFKLYFVIFLSLIFSESHTSAMIFVLHLFLHVKLSLRLGVILFPVVLYSVFSLKFPDLDFSVMGFFNWMVPRLSVYGYQFVNFIDISFFPQSAKPLSLFDSFYDFIVNPFRYIFSLPILGFKSLSEFQYYLLHDCAVPSSCHGGSSPGFLLSMLYSLGFAAPIVVFFLNFFQGINRKISLLQLFIIIFLLRHILSGVGEVFYFSPQSIIFYLGFGLAIHFKIFDIKTHA